MSNLDLAQKLRQAIQDIAQVKEKANLFGGNLKELHSKSITEEVIVSGNYISLGMSFDATLQDGNRMQLSELIVYK